MADEKKINLYRNIIGDTKATIDAIQRYISEHSARNTNIDMDTDEAPAESINRILSATACEETCAEIQSIINRL